MTEDELAKHERICEAMDEALATPTGVDWYEFAKVARNWWPKYIADVRRLQAELESLLVQLGSKAHRVSELEAEIVDRADCEQSLSAMLIEQTDLNKEKDAEIARLRQG